MLIAVRFNDRSLHQYAERLRELSSSGHSILAEALNASGDALRQATVAAETVQTGLTQDTIGRAQQAQHSSGALVYSIRSKGGNVRLKYFGAKEGGGGVTAHPWNRSTFYGGAFITSGRMGNRKPSPKLKGQVFKNAAGGKWGGKIRAVRSGLYIPTEMVTGRTASIFESQAAVIAQTIVTRLGSMI